jgi:DNA-binding HxlR family transcriptional regulator
MGSDGSAPVKWPVAYALTELGGSLCAPVQELRSWAERHIDAIRCARDCYDEAAA